MRPIALLVVGLSLGALPARSAAEPALSLPNEHLSDGRWLANAYCLGTTEGNKGLGLFEFHLGLGRVLVGGLSAGVEFSGGYATFASGTPSQTWSTGFDLVLRWHFLRSDWGSVFADAHGGVRAFGISFPRRGTQYDFAAQVGVGGTIRLFEGVNLMAGGGWFHVSNAALRGVYRNPGFNAIKFYGGLLLDW